MSKLWPPEHVAYLAELADAGLKTYEAAAEMNRRFGTAYDKNCVIGLSHRRGIKWKLSPGFPPNPYKPRLRVLKHTRKAATQDDPPVSKPKTKPIPLIDLTNTTCRWPIGTNPILFCGAPEADLANGVPYCPYHSRIAYSRCAA